jgi:hypothetical protein
VCERDPVPQIPLGLTQMGTRGSNLMDDRACIDRRGYGTMDIFLRPRWLPVSGGPALFISLNLCSISNRDGSTFRGYDRIICSAGCAAYVQNGIPLINRGFEIDK